MRFKYQAIAVLPALLITVAPAIAQPKSTTAPQTSPSLNSQQQRELQQFQKEKRLQELIKKDLEDSKVIVDRVQAEVDRAFSRTTTLLNILLVVLTLFPILTVLGFWLLRRSVLSESLAEITKSGEEIKRETEKQSNTAKEEIAQVASETKNQLEGMVSEAKSVLQSLREQIALAQKELATLSSETKSQFQEAFSDVQREKDRIFQELSEITPLPSSNPKNIPPEVQQKIQELTEQLDALKASNPQLLFTASDYEKQGDAFFSEGRYEDSAESYRRALKSKNDDATLWNRLGIAQIALEQFEKALESFNQANKIDSNKADVWNNHGMALKMLQYYSEALDSLDKAIYLDPVTIDWQRNLGTVLMDLKDYEAVTRCYGKILESTPKDYQVWAGLGVALDALERHEEAIYSYDKSIEIEPDDYKIWLYKGDSLLQLNKHEEAFKAFDRASELSDNSCESWTMRGLALQKMKRYHEASASYNRAIQSASDYHLAWYDQARCHALQNNLDLAIQYLKQAISLNLNYKTDAKNNSDFDSIRGDERFKQLLEE